MLLKGINGLNKNNKIPFKENSEYHGANPSYIRNFINAERNKKK
jgi:hypothetical protein